MKRTMFSDPERRKQRQEEAAERQAARDKLSPEEQLRKLAARGVTSGREYERLLKKMGYLVPRGQTLTREEYPDLYAAIDYAAKNGGK